jgi:hypothetical protein
MNKSFLFLVCAITLTTVSCNQDKPEEVEVATKHTASTSYAVSKSREAAIPVADTAAFRIEADRIAERIAKDLRLTDPVAVTKVQKTYYTRGRRLREANTRYATDTTGRYAALRSINDKTDRSIKTIVTNPEQYKTYKSNREDYYEGTPYTEIETIVEATAARRPVAAARRRGPAIVKYKNRGGILKIKYANGAKVKIGEDGKRKVLRAGNTKSRLKGLIGNNVKE